MPEDRGSNRNALVEALMNGDIGDVGATPNNPATNSRVAVAPSGDPDADVAVREEIATEEVVEEPPVEEAPDEAAIEEPKPVEQSIEKDPGISKKLNFLRQQEKKAKNEIMAARAEVEKASEALNYERKAVSEFKVAMSAAKRDPAALMLAIGFTESELAQVAQDIFFSSAEASKHPQYKTAYERAKQSRHAQAEAELARQKTEELEQRMTQREQRIALNEQMASYKEALGEAITDKHVFVKKVLTKNRDQARQAMYDLAVSIANKTHTIPSPQEVAEQLEERLRNELRYYDVDVDAIAGKTNPEAKAPPAKRTLTSDMGGRTPARDEVLEDPKAIRADILRRMETGQFD
jgi:hypothetical protein